MLPEYNDDLKLEPLEDDDFYSQYPTSDEDDDEEDDDFIDYDD